MCLYIIEATVISVSAWGTIREVLLNKLAEVVTLVTSILEDPVQILAGTATILTEIFCAFPQSVQANARIVY